MKEAFFRRFDDFEWIQNITALFREKKPFCTNCFESRFAEICHSCRNSIGLDEGQMQYHGYHWHATDKV